MRYIVHDTRDDVCKHEQELGPARRAAIAIALVGRNSFVYCIEDEPGLEFGVQVGQYSFEPAGVGFAHLTEGRTR